MWGLGRVLSLQTRAGVKTLALALLIALTSQVHAASSCGDLFRTPPSRVQALVQLVLKKPTLEIEQQALVEDATSAFRHLPRKERAIWNEIAAKIGSEITNPYKIGFDLNEASARFHSSARNELRLLFTILARHRVESRINALDRWVKSETHALVLHKVLSLRGLALYKTELHALHSRNVFFSDAYEADGTFLTFAFEKEGRGKEIGMLYRPAAVSEADWFKEDDTERYNTIFKRELKQKVFLPASVLAPTSLKPDYIGGFSFDGYGEKRSWEISHKGYELSLHRTLQEIRDVSKLVGETHSFHVHAVFEMAKDDPSFPQFIRWFKGLNDALYLKGMEEGLHGDDLTSVASLQKDIARTDNGRTISVMKPTDIARTNQKFFSAGLRAQIYGPASSPERMKIGIELRDTTRKLQQLEASMTNVSESLSKRVWERLPKNDSTDFARLHTNSERTVAALVKAGLRMSTARELLKAEPTVGLPYLPLEAKPVFNFKTGEYESASEAYVARAVHARAAFTQGLMALQEELDGFKARGEDVDSEDIQIAIRQTLTEWARSARPSERFGY